MIRGCGRLLQGLYLNQNRVSGTTHSMNSILGDLSVLDLDSNKISGSLSASISALSSLQVLLVHNNLMSGSCPSFALLKALEILTLFNNRFNGRLVLPTDATLDALLVHSNRYIPSPALLCALCFARSLLRLKHQLSYVRTILVPSTKLSSNHMRPHSDS